ERESPERFRVALTPPESVPPRHEPQPRSVADRITPPESNSLPLLPQLSGLVFPGLPFDLPSLQLGIQRFLEQLDRLGAQPDALARGRGIVPWLAAAAIAAVACELARRQLRPARPDPPDRPGPPSPT